MTGEHWQAGRLVAAGLVVALAAATLAAADEAIDFEKAHQLIQKQRQGEALTAEEKAYVDRAREARAKAQPASRPADPAGKDATMQATSTGMIPLTDMTAKDTYKGQDGGLYGGGQNRPPKDHQAAAEKQLAAIGPLDAEGKPAPGGKIGFIGVGMSNTTQEFSAFQALAEADKDKLPRVAIVDCAQGGRDVASWADETARDYAGTWQTARQRLAAAGVSAAQVQVAWLKQARRQVGLYGEFPRHAEEFNGHLVKLLGLLKREFPNLRIVYLSSRTYAGYATTTLNPEPYAYENAFAVRQVILDQIKGDPRLNYDQARGKVVAPLLLWGPYLWADGLKGRKTDSLAYAREDFARDGTHPSEASGRKKVAELLLAFLKTDPNARGWFLSAQAAGAAQPVATSQPSATQGVSSRPVPVK